jgi:hypothetical protein
MSILEPLIRLKGRQRNFSEMNNDVCNQIHVVLQRAADALGPKLRAYTAAIVVRLRDLAPYALIELVLPGGSVMALLLWLYRRQRKASVFATQEILALL